MQPTDIYEVRSRKDKRGVDLISDVLPFGRLWYSADFLIKKLPPPTPDRYERRLFPPEHFGKQDRRR